MKKTLLAATLLFTLPAIPAFAHDDDYYDRYQHERDHRSHYRYHDRTDYEHARAHQRAWEEGGWEPGEHAAYHRYLRWRHRDFHEDHPNTWHDHYRY
jgi:hypothetical protein